MDWRPDYTTLAGVRVLKYAGRDRPVYARDRSNGWSLALCAVVTLPSSLTGCSGVSDDAKGLLFEVTSLYSTAQAEHRIYYRDRHHWLYSYKLGDNVAYQVDRASYREFYDWLVGVEALWLSEPAGPEGPMGPAGFTELFETTPPAVTTAATAPTTTPLNAAPVAATETTKMSYGDDKMTKLKDWTGEVALAGAEGAKDGTALAAADIIIEALEAAILPKLPFLAVYKYNSFTEALGKMAFLWSVGAADRLGFLGDVGVAPVAARAVRALATVHVAPLGLRLIEPLREAMKKVHVLDGLSSK